MNPFVDPSYMDETTFASAKTEYLKKLTPFSKEINLYLEDNGCEEPPEIIIEVPSNEYSFISNLSYGAKFIKFRDQMCKKYGVHRVSCDKILDEHITDVPLGSLVLIDDNYSDEPAIGLVVSSYKEKGVTHYRCCHILFGFQNDNLDQEGLYLTADDYAGAYTGFSKILTPNEAQKHLSKCLESEYKRHLATVKHIKDGAKDQIESLVKVLKDKKLKVTDNIERVRWTADESWMPENLRLEAEDEDEDEN